MPKTADIRVGMDLPPLRKTIVQRQIDCYSGVRPNSIHTDLEWAKQKGFPRTLVQAMMSTAYVSQIMMRWLGEGFVKGGQITASFIQPVYEGDTLTARAVVTRVEDMAGRPHVTVECWCENQAGAKTMVGSASGFTDHLRD